MKSPRNSVKNRYGRLFCATLRQALLRQAYLCLVLVGFHIQAQTKNSPIGVGPSQGRGAIIIGISQYKEVTPLQFADRDAVAFAEFLKTQQVPEDNIKLFLNEEATRFAIVDELYNTTQSLQKGDRFYFYFGGHGDLEARIGYENSLLLLYNSFQKSYFQGNEYLQLSELKTWFEALTKKGVEVVFIADACHSGGLIGGKEGLTKTQRALQESWAGITKILSCKSDEFSLEGKQWGGGRGIFSYHLVNGLTGLADTNKDKKITLAELNKYLSVNVLREADPNVQTPVVQGNNKQLLAKTDDASLKKLREDLMRSVPIITEVNMKAKEEKMIGELDRSLVETYNKFTKSLADKRLNTFDDEKDYALLYYRKLVAAKIPDRLLQIIKRNLGAGLMGRELEIMKELREKGATIGRRGIQNMDVAIRNLQEAMKILGPAHYITPLLQSRIYVLEGQSPNKSVGVVPPDSVMFVVKRAGIRRRGLYFKALQLEPNMVSTYAIIAKSYDVSQQPDSAAYYYEKVVEALPNEASINLIAGYNYSRLPYTDAQNRPAPHPKAQIYLERAVELDPTMKSGYSMLAEVYLGERYDKANRNYPKSIINTEKILVINEAEEQEYIKKIGPEKYLQEIKKEAQSDTNYAYKIQFKYFTRLSFLYKTAGDTAKATLYLNKILQKAEMGQTAYNYLEGASALYGLLYYDNEELYLKKALELQQKAIQKAGEELKIASPKDKPLMALKYREHLKGMGAVHRALRNDEEAEKYLLQSFDYPIPDTPIKSKLKCRAVGIEYKNRDISVIMPKVLSDFWYQGKEYTYYQEANFEMFLLKWEQNKPDEAFAWLEKAFQNSVKEHGNDISEKLFEEMIFRIYKDLDQDRFKALKAKYFPPK